MNFLRNAREWATPQLRDSAFLERGVLTPEEFVAAGDQLVFRCPTWQWEGGDPARLRPYLPPDKQFLVTRGVPCRTRVASLNTITYDDDNEDADGWTNTHLVTQSEDDLEVIGGAEEPEPLQTETVTPPPPPAAAAAPEVEKDDLDDEYEDLASFEQEGLAEDMASLAVGGASDDNVVRTRTYDMSITYDKYYQTPRVWLLGYDESNQPLTEAMIFEDVIQDYVQRTVTMDPHPHLGTLHASVHPCKHAITMKRIVDALSSNGGEPKTAQYMFIFLKFMGSVVPTIEYDFTMSTAARSD
jgi:ubiquitin-like-conjugating enzyme ATG3